MTTAIALTFLFSTSKSIGQSFSNNDSKSRGEFTVTATAGANVANVQIDNGTTGTSATATVEEGSNVTFKAFTGVNIYFTGWYDDSEQLVSTEPSYTFTVTEAVNYTAKASSTPILWTKAVSSQPGIESWEVVNDTILIKDKYGLAWFISYVNGFNGQSEHATAAAKLCADVDMGQYVWVPIGYSSLHEFKGFFDGQCYSIDNIHISNAAEHNAVEAAHNNLQRVGLFGYSDGIDVVTEARNAYIKNTFVTSGKLYGNSSFTYVGSVVGSANETTLEFCEGAAEIYVGNGISAGSVAGSVIHDSYVYGCMGMSTIQSSATNTGGIAGAQSDISTGTEVSYIEHSFANSDITALTTSAYKTGAIVGHFYGKGYADASYVHPDATGATNVLGDKGTDLLVPESEKTPRCYAYNPNMKYQYIDVFLLPDVTIPVKGIYTAVSSTDYNHHATGNNVTVSGSTQPLCDELNSRTFHDGTTLESLGLHWDRVYGITAINGDYPILYPQNKINGRVIAVGQRAGEKALRYGSVDDLIKQCNANPDGGTIYMYQNDTIRVSTNANVVVYVNDTVALMQEAATVNAVVAITLDNTKGNGEMNRDWHLFSATIEEGKLGINYGAHQSSYYYPDYQHVIDYPLTFGQEGESWDYYLKQGDEAVYFPDGITTAISNPGGQFDIYSFFEEKYHWINLKRASTNHWHQDEPHDKINYTNEMTFVPGKGYMIALGDKTTHNNNLMQAKGVLNNGTIDATVTNKGNHLNGYNLLGNPYQSYLDFRLFANDTENAKALWSSTSAKGYKAYLIYDADIDGFREYLVDNEGQSFSQNAAYPAEPYINMHQGFFVVKNSTTDNNEATVHFTNAMRATNQTPHFRNEQPAYPLVNLFCTDSDGKQEISVIEIERPSNAGSLKMKSMLNAKGNMYIHLNEEDFGSVFIDHTPEYVPVWFKASEDGIFTMSWNTANDDFGYLHLVDNITGADIDCLNTDSYEFEAHTSDSKARFRLVFSALGIEENGNNTNSSFAFFNGSELVVNGSGELSLIDLNGRVISTQHVSGQQSHLAQPNVAAGLYMLRLANNDGVRVQKIVVRR